MLPNGTGRFPILSRRSQLKVRYILSNGFGRDIFICIYQHSFHLQELKFHECICGSRDGCVHQRKTAEVDVLMFDRWSIYKNWTAQWWYIYEKRSTVEGGFSVQLIQPFAHNFDGHNCMLNVEVFSVIFVHRDKCSLFSVNVAFIECIGRPVPMANFKSQIMQNETLLFQHLNICVQFMFRESIHVLRRRVRH